MTSPRRTGRAPVAVVRTRPETYEEDLRRAWRLAHPARRGPGGESGRAFVVTLAPGSGRGPGALAPPWAVEATLRLVWEARGASGLAVLGTATAAAAALAGTGIERVLERAALGCETARADTEIEVGAVDLPWLRGRRGAAVRVDGRLIDRDAAVVASLRRCREMGIRGAVDAAIAAVATPRERADGALDPEAWAELLRLRLHLHAASTFVLDATVCGSEDGRHRPAICDLLVVSTDPVACDVVGAGLLGIAPGRLPWLRRVAAETRTPLDFTALDLRGESLDARALEEGLAARPAAIPGAARPVPRILARLRAAADPALWVRGWNRRRWSEHYARTPWGRLHQEYREPGRERARRSRQERA